MEILLCNLFKNSIKLLSREMSKEGEGVSAEFIQREDEKNA
jgi:hypothetical protein